ncbi:MAG: DUF3307 domain-containing protein [Muribaculaceae bacterium]|nr:DUF3307 domain-containing protein [Muribaculaceae bacterium]
MSALRFKKSIIFAVYFKRIMQFVLIISLLICHFLADYCLTTPQMIKAKASGKKLQHIFLHSFVHSILMSLVFVAFSRPLKIVFLLFAFEFCTHFIIDYLKGLVGRLYPAFADNRQKQFWVLYGLDQLLHLLVIVAMVYIALE